MLESPMLKIVAILCFAVFALVDSPGSALTTGMQLVYSSADAESPPWKIVSVSDTTIGGMSSCRVIVLRMDSARPPERRNWCVSGDMLLSWDTTSRSLRPIRPVGEGMSLEVPGARGSRSSYTTRSALEQTVSGIRVRVLETVVVTRDSTGRQVRRLREFYSPALATATSGVFEVPDSVRANNWLIQSSFKLVRITP